MVLSGIGGEDGWMMPGHNDDTQDMEDEGWLLV